MTFLRWILLGGGVACAACGQIAPGELDEQAASALAPPTVVVASPSQEACKVSNTAAGAVDDLSCKYDLLDADLGITVNDEKRTWVLFGDTFPTDTKAGPASADATGYFAGRDPQAGLCGGLHIVSVDDVTSTQTCATHGGVYASDPVFLAQPWPATTIADFVFQPAGSPDEAEGALPSSAAIPGPFEVPTGAFAYEGNIYTFYSGAPGILGSKVAAVGDNGLPAVSYLTSWAPPDDDARRSARSRHAPATVSAPFTAAESRQIVSMVDYVGVRAPTPRWSSSDTLGGRFVQIAPVVSHRHLYLFGTGKYRNSHVYLARLPLPIDHGPLTFPQYLSQTPGFEVWSGSAWSSTASDAAALAFADDPAADVGEISVQHFEEGGVWLMMYTPSLTGAHAGNVMMRWATSPSGPWTAMTSVLDFASKASDATYCCAGAPPGGCTGLQLYGCVGGATVYGLYAPYMLPYLTPVSESTFRVWYTISGTWPYTTALMSFDVDITR